MALTDAFFATILPLRLFTSRSFVKPPTVFTLTPLKTATLARFPTAMVLTDFFFITGVLLLEELPLAAASFSPPFLVFFFPVCFAACLEFFFGARAMTDRNEGGRVALLFLWHTR